MTTAEMQLRREKNLCFTCDEKFSPTRRCPNRQYFILQYEEDANFDKLPDSPDDTSLADNPQILDHHLSYNALNGSFWAWNNEVYGYYQWIGSASATRQW